MSRALKCPFCDWQVPNGTKKRNLSLSCHLRKVHSLSWGEYLYYKRRGTLPQAVRESREKKAEKQGSFEVSTSNCWNPVKNFVRHPEDNIKQEEFDTMCILTTMKINRITGKIVKRDKRIFKI